MGKGSSRGETALENTSTTLNPSHQSTSWSQVHGGGHPPASLEAELEEEGFRRLREIGPIYER